MVLSAEKNYFSSAFFFIRFQAVYPKNMKQSDVLIGDPSQSHTCGRRGPGKK